MLDTTDTLGSGGQLGPGQMDVLGPNGNPPNTATFNLVQELQQQLAGVLAKLADPDLPKKERVKLLKLSKKIQAALTKAEKQINLDQKLGSKADIATIKANTKVATQASKANAKTTLAALAVEEAGAGFPELDGLFAAAESVPGDTGGDGPSPLLIGGGLAAALVLTLLVLRRR